MPRCAPCSDFKCSTRPLLVSIKISETGIRMHSYLRIPHTRFLHSTNVTHESYAYNSNGFLSTKSTPNKKHGLTLLLIWWLWLCLNTCMCVLS
jgi:hypothetical protein